MTATRTLSLAALSAVLLCAPSFVHAQPAATPAVVAPAAPTAAPGAAPVVAAPAAAAAGAAPSDAVVVSTDPPPAAPSARELLDRIDDLYRGSSSHAVMVMKVVTQHWTRELEVEAWSRGKERSLMRILAPRKEKGTATLKSGNNIWNYLPKVRRVIKVPSSMMGGSWMGSHFTNDDLVKENRMAEDFAFEVSGRGGEGAGAWVEITCMPKPDAAVVWGKVVVRVRPESSMPDNIRYFDEDMELARTMTFSDVETLGGRALPTVMRVVPADKPGESTEVRYKSMRFDTDVPESLFTLRSLQR